MMASELNCTRPPYSNEDLLNIIMLVRLGVTLSERMAALKAIIAHSDYYRQRVEALEVERDASWPNPYWKEQAEHFTARCAEQGTSIADLTTKLEACEQERDQWKDKHEYLDYFFNSAITERNELRVAKQSLIDTKKALQRQLQQREEAYNDLIMQVGKKFPEESRHDTAKRYIQTYENQCGQGGPCMDATREKGVE